MKFDEKHVETAFELLRERGIQPNKPSTKWDVIDPKTGERFPPKAVLRVAKETAHDKSHSGGGGPQTNGPLKQRGFDIVLKPGLEPSDVVRDIEEILSSESDKTTKERLVNARLGQGGFREGLIEIWGGKCALTGCTILQALRASHIKPWRVSTNAERLDTGNGLLLAASVDALFDKFLITFDGNGAVRASTDLESKALELLGFQAGKRVNLILENEKFMSWHRDEFSRVTGGASWTF